MFIEAEIELIKLMWQARSFVTENNQPRKSRIYFVPKSKGLGIDSMGEFAVTLELSNQFINEEGNPASFIDISNTLANAFNFTFGDAYKSKGRVFIRKPYNLTKALDFLKNLLIRESRNRKMKKDVFVSN